eukprot:gene5406-5946_t
MSWNSHHSSIGDDEEIAKWILRNHFNTTPLWMTFHSSSSLNNLFDEYLDRDQLSYQNESSFLFGDDDHDNEENRITIRQYEQREAPKASPFLGDVYHPLQSCKLWWPLNESELHLHGPVPQELSVLIVKQKAIISCENNDYKRLVILDHGAEVKSCENARRMEVDLPLSSQNDGGAVEVDFTLLLAHRDNHRSRHYLEFYLIESIRTFNCEAITRTKEPISLILFKQYLASKANTLPVMIPSWATSLESRDDLGFALRFWKENLSFVEVGVSRGNYAQLILHSSMPKFYLGVDSWNHWHDGMYEDVGNVPQVVHLQHLAEAVSRVSMFPSAHLLRMESVAAATMIKDESIDIVYLDAMHHYAAVGADLRAWWPKVRPCGIISGHDYLLRVIGKTIFTVRPAVQEFARRHGGLHVLHTEESDHCPVYPSWFMFKPCKN